MIIDLHRTKEEQAAAMAKMMGGGEDSDCPIKVHVCSPEFEKLGLDKMKVGDCFEVVTRFCVERLESSEGGNAACLCIEGMAQPKKVTNDAKALYPNLKSSMEGNDE